MSAISKLAGRARKALSASNSTTTPGCDRTSGAGQTDRDGLEPLYSDTAW